MREFIATVTKIDSSEHLNIVTFRFLDYSLTMMSLDLSDISVGSSVKLSCKPTSIALAKEFSGDISLSNALKATITSIDIGKLLCSVKLDVDGVEFESIITTSSLNRMRLKEDDSLTIFIKASELSIKEVL